jgi:hypothetical protein
VSLGQCVGVIALGFGPLTSDPSPPRDALELVASVEATFTLRVDNEVVYQEPYFPVVELALSLHRWLKRPLSAQEDFEFESMHIEEPGWVWIRREGSGWRVGSIHQERAVMKVWSSEEVEGVATLFATRLADEIGTAFGAPMRVLFEALARDADI